MAIYIVQSKKTGAIVSAGLTRPSYQKEFAGLSREFVGTFWVIEVPDSGDYLYHNADTFVEAFEDGV